MTAMQDNGTMNMHLRALGKIHATRTPVFSPEYAICPPSHWQFTRGTATLVPLGEKRHCMPKSDESQKAIMDLHHGRGAFINEITITGA